MGHEAEPGPSCPGLVGPFGGRAGRSSDPRVGRGTPGEPQDYLLPSLHRRGAAAGAEPVPALDKATDNLFGAVLFQQHVIDRVRLTRASSLGCSFPVRPGKYDTVTEKGLRAGRGGGRGATGRVWGGSLSLLLSLPCLLPP